MRVFSLLRACGILYIAWLEGVCHLLVQELYFVSSPGVLATVSTHLVTPTAVLKLISFLLFPLTKKKATSVFRVLANHLVSFFFPHPVWRFVRTTISSTRVRLRGTDSLTHILFFLQQAGRIWPTFLIPLLTVNLWQPVNSNTGEFLISLLSVVDHVTIPCHQKVMFCVWGFDSEDLRSVEYFFTVMSTLTLGGSAC